MEARTARALELWQEAKALGELARRYFASRGIPDLSALPDVHSVLRFHPRCPFSRDARHPGIIALWTDAPTAAPRAIHRTALRSDGMKLGRMSLGPATGCVIRLWPDETVMGGLVIGEGLETVLAAATRIEHRGTLLQPAWAAGDAGHIAKFPAHPGIEALTILVDHDEPGKAAARACAQRWKAAGREIELLALQGLGEDFANVAEASP